MIKILSEMGTTKGSKAGKRHNMTYFCKNHSGYCMEKAVRKQTKKGKETN